MGVVAENVRTMTFHSGMAQVSIAIRVRIVLTKERCKR